MYAALTEETVRLVAEKGTQKGSVDFGHRSSRRTTDKVICTPVWCIAKSSAAVVHITFYRERPENRKKRWVINCLNENDRDHMHPMSGTGDHQPR